MCKHVLNAQVSIRTACCRRWVDCIECHDEVADHPLLRTAEMTLICKKCRKAFRVYFGEEMDDSDEFCPNCDNHYVVNAITEPPKPAKPLPAELDARMIPDDKELEELLDDTTHLG
ncbi:hypothetical protein SPOG_04623 [Schizosaccharomyces cryophilus OY26]|uniref:CHY-type domain-containing protein n=1 Tax=Schizosaccharomyces cryophilus (strain OY26 / ATCC MYA-4695 / CBS 11777 / NBRC 106824 / NRRL Y48691) TaxID=653667 RepID=S9W0Z8_SCHCR|nr:uncharacterized protein SPOG_04623 [Schizosaccharomyces cryophilus OY26]EPY53563.1 hypothetical protein SPOG_04623 [Schizosaccharomyces cryophilus OY26]